MNTQDISGRSIDEIIDRLQIVCSQVAESVVVINAITRIADGGHSLNTGTAYCVDERGYFVTALHVVAGQISTFIVAEAELPASVLAVDELNDLAIVYVHNRQGFKAVTFATALPADGEIVGGLGYPASGLAVELCSYLGRYCGQVVDGVGPNGLRLEGDMLRSALCFIGAQSGLDGYSGGPLISEYGQVVAMTVKADDELGFVVGPSGSVVNAFVKRHVLPSDTDNCTNE